MPTILSFVIFSFLLLLSVFSCLAQVAETAAILDYATSGNLLALSKALSENPSLVNFRNNLGFTPLILATSSGHRDLVQHLLQHGANVNQVEDDNWSPLMFAAYQVTASSLI